MPNRPNTPCRHPGCAALVPYGQQYCDKHKALHPGDGRPSAARRGYDHRWRVESRKYLLEHPLCVKCLEKDKITQATVVDHIQAHRGNARLFWDKSNWQSLCKHCHDVKTMTEDRLQEYHF